MHIREKRKEDGCRTKENILTDSKIETVKILIQQVGTFHSISKQRFSAPTFIVLARFSLTKKVKGRWFSPSRLPKTPLF